MNTVMELDSTPSEAIAQLRSQLPARRKRLAALASIAVRAGETALSHEARQVAQDLHVHRLRVAFVGEFKAGKSSLINALLCQDVVPVKLQECTATVCRVRLDPAGREGIRVRSSDGRMGPRRPLDLHALARLAQDRSSPAEEVEVTLASAGWPGPEVELVDTPGARAGGLHGERLTLAWLPHADAVVFVTRADRPMGAAELRLLREHVLHGEREDAVLVVNHADALATRGERARVRDRVEASVRQATGGCPPILFVSAADALDAQDAIAEVDAAGGPVVGPLELKALRESGVPALRTQLDKQLVERRAWVAQRAHNEREASLRRRLTRALTIRVEDAQLDVEAATRRSERLRTLQRALAKVPAAVRAVEAPRFRQLQADLDRELSAATPRLISTLKAGEGDRARAGLQEVADRFRARLKAHQASSQASVRLELSQLVDADGALHVRGPERVHVGSVDGCFRTVSESNDVVGMAVGAGLIALFTAPALIPLIALGAAAASTSSTRQVADHEATAQQAISELRASISDALSSHQQRLSAAIDTYVSGEVDTLRRRLDAMAAPATTEHAGLLRSLVAELVAAQ